MNRFGVVLDDFGFETMLQKLVDDFISPISQCIASLLLVFVYCCKSLLYSDVLMVLVFDVFSVLFPEVCGTGLDSHHGFIVEYGKDRDTDLGIVSLFVSLIWGGGNI